MSKRFRTRVLTRGVIPTLHVIYKCSKIEQYHKEGQALRTETTINDTYDFKVGRILKNLDELRQIGFSANRRLLSVQTLSHDCLIGEVRFQQLTHPIQEDEQRASALPFEGKRVLAAFLFCGLLATGTDILVYQLLHSVFGAAPSLSRLFSVSLAMIVGWSAHRRFTFVIKTPPVLRELIAYADVAWISVSVNYVCFLIILYLMPELPGSVDIIFSSAVTMMVSFLGMRFGVFRNAS